MIHIRRLFYGCLYVGLTLLAIYLGVLLVKLSPHVFCGVLAAFSVYLVGYAIQNIKDWYRR